jgi:hypothetical protein
MPRGHRTKELGHASVTPSPSAFLQARRRRPARPCAFSLLPHSSISIPITRRIPASSPSIRRERRATRQLRIRAHGATGRVAEAASYKHELTAQRTRRGTHQSMKLRARHVPPQWRTIGSTLPPLHDDWRLDDVTIRRMGVAGAVILLITLWGFLCGGLRPSEKSQSFPRLACFTS